MKKQEIQEWNKLIAEFMDFKILGGLWGNVPQYESSWMWLMPVIDKIETIPGWRVDISGKSCEISHLDSEPVYTGFDGTKILSTYKAVLNFIIWHKSYTGKTV